jgi:oxalate decarboxylase/phosphoglucose isomerase-like protein (cupin superfamily)
MNALRIISLPDRFYQEPRGWTFTPFNESPLAGGGSFDWTSFHTVSMKPGSIRGNHLHPRVSEWLLFCGGPFLIVWQDEGSEAVQQKQITDHHTFLVIPPRVKHAVKNTGKEWLYLVAFRSRAHGSDEPETLAAPLLY